jgi:hypothetical protein
MTHPTSPGTMLAAALDAARRGWSVFPLVAGAKVPAIEQWPQRATSDTDRIERYWSHPASCRHGVGIACGPSGLLVIDLDQPKPGQAVPPRWQRPGICDGSDVLADLCDHAGQPFPFHTHTVRTGRGGLHLYFTQPAGEQLRNTEGSKGHGLGWLIDTRGHGGYVVAAGTTVNGHRYDTIHDTEPAPLPGWLTDRLTPAVTGPQAGAAAGPVQLRTTRRSAYLDAAIRAELEHVTTAPEGERNKALFIAAQNLGQLAAGGNLDTDEVRDLLTAAAAAPIAAGAYTARQADKTITSGLRAGAKRPRKVAA